MTFLSIIVPIHKVEPYLRQCLDSIAASPLDSWEAILVDDGSPDNCPQICDEYAARDRRFRVIHQQNAGVAAARNAGLDAAQGEWCWFVDADDVVDMRFVQDMASWLQSHDGADMAMFDFQTFSDGEAVNIGAGTARPMVVAEMADIEEFMDCYICYHHQRLWYRRGWPNDHHQRDTAEWHRREAMRTLRFTTGIRVGEDLEFQYKFLTLCRRPFKFDMTLYYYRLRGNSATGDAAYRRKAVEDLPVILHHLAAWTKEHRFKPQRWYDYRIRKLLQNLLYSAELVNDDPKEEFDIRAFQKQVRTIVREYRALGFPLAKNIKILLAKWSVKAYFQLNRAYLRHKGVR